ncbi:hypothetical protein PACTADRAFT_58345 [Pachysolen tannophilus NRRL Y-2460]|uniref:Endoplasmic reticulum transmembrane protein n=1 Tax=Pachysolen tannophilus NRRL Y-2460 TaxID=669874 RepID=A0A1E4TUR9_PACTA|nr:hypothetical protein PACTADRAFT_58345 [Pachysolen tannophilus NRRL Y-2460]
MSIQMLFIFVALIVEMVMLSILVLPLPFVVRKKVVEVFHMLITISNFRIGMYFIGVIISIMFIDSFNRSSIKASQYPVVTGGSSSRFYLTSTELASRNYNQRNMYLTGAVLYFGIAIPTVISILKKLIKHKTKLENAKKVDDTEKVASIKAEIKKKDLDIETFKKQLKGLNEAYIKISNELNNSNSDKKKD